MLQRRGHPERSVTVLRVPRQDVLKGGDALVDARQFLVVVVPFAVGLQRHDRRPYVIQITPLVTRRDRSVRRNINPRRATLQSRR
jgi:hypothetical protein